MLSPQSYCLSPAFYLDVPKACIGAGGLDTEGDELAAFGGCDRDAQLRAKTHFILDDVVGRQHDHDRVCAIGHQAGSSQCDSRGGVATDGLEQCLVGQQSMIRLAFGVGFLRNDQNILCRYQRRQTINGGLQQRCLALQR